MHIGGNDVWWSVTKKGKLFNRAISHMLTNKKKYEEYFQFLKFRWLFVADAWEICDFQLKAQCKNIDGFSMLFVKCIQRRGIKRATQPSTTQGALSPSPLAWQRWVQSPSLCSCLAEYHAPQEMLGFISNKISVNFRIWSCITIKPLIK